MQARENSGEGKQPAGAVSRWTNALVRATWTLKAAVKAMRHHKAFAASVICTLTGCLLINVIALSVMYSVLWRPLPFREPERLVVLSKSYTKGNVTHAPCSLVQYLDYSAHIEGLEGMAFCKQYSAIFGDSSQLTMIGVERSSPTLLDVLGVKPVIGTYINAEQCRRGADRVLVLMYGFWLSQFGGDPSVLGRTVFIDNEPYSVIGVAPQSLETVLPGVKALKPYPWADSDIASETARLTQSPFLTGQIIARVKDGMSAEQLTAKLALRERQIYEGAGTAYRTSFDQSGVVTSASDLNEERGREVRSKLFILECAALLVLVIGCANIANLLTARVNVRTSEFAVRIALGATKADVALLVMAEALVYTLVGSVIAVLATFGFFKGGGGLIADLLKLPTQVMVDWRVLVLGCVASALIGVIVGLLPGLRISSDNLSAAFQDGARTASSGRKIAGLNSLLVIAQIGFAFLLLSCAVLVLYGFARLVSQSPGFQTTNVVKFRYSQPPATISETFHEDVIRTLKESSGILEVAVGSHTPTSKDASYVVNPIVVELPPPANELKHGFAIRVGVSADYFRILSIPIVGGRNFNEQEGHGGRNCVIVDQRFARLHFPNSDPIGRRFSFRLVPSDPSDWVTIVGVANEVRFATADDVKDAPMVYFPYPDWLHVSNTIFVKTQRPVGEVLPLVRAAVAKANPGVAVYRADTMDHVVIENAAGRRTLVFLICGFGLGALILAVSGVYSVQAFNINSRAREIAIRSALGADRRRLIGLAIRQSVYHVATGLLVGAIGVLAVFRMSDGVLIATTGLAPFFPLAVAIIVGLVGVVSSIVACWRVVSLSPVEVLKWS